VNDVETQPLPELRRDAICLRAGDELTIVLPHAGVQKSFEVDEPVFALLPLLDGTRTRQELASDLGVTTDWLDEIVAVLVDEDLVEHPLDLTELSAEARERFDRQLRFLSRLPGVPPVNGAVAALRRLTAARVVVIGAGSTGSALALSLARAGVGWLRVVDPDRVELTNLAAQHVYSLHDVGRPKVEALAAAVAAVDPAIEVDAVIATVEDAVDLGVLIPDDAALVVVCADSPSTSILAGWVSGHCVPRGIPHLVGGGYAGATGSLGLLVAPGVTACWDCFTGASDSPLADAGRTTVRGQRGGAGSFGPLAGAVANVLAFELARFLATGSSSLAGFVSEIRFDPLGVDRRAVEMAPECACRHALAGEVLTP
jgi:molybdopterin/thiamine biosynthesis adenylyltransferase